MDGFLVGLTLGDLVGNFVGEVYRTRRRQVRHSKIYNQYHRFFDPFTLTVGPRVGDGVGLVDGESVGLALG